MARGQNAVHFLGLSLGGGKTDRTHMAFIEYFPIEKKIFLSRLILNIGSQQGQSSDEKLIHLISSYPAELKQIGLDAPKQLPKCIRCTLKCPGFEVCEEPEILWLRKHYLKINEKKRPKRQMTPYTERCVDLLLLDELEEPFHPSHALGANRAPLTARAHYLLRRLLQTRGKKQKYLEVFPALSLWRIGRALGLRKGHLRQFSHATEGKESRKVILEKLVQKDLAFIYDQDFRLLLEDSGAFSAFIIAVTCVLESQGQCEPRPRGFPKSEDWISFPKEKFSF